MRWGIGGREPQQGAAVEGVASMLGMHTHIQAHRFVQTQPPLAATPLAMHMR